MPSGRDGAATAPSGRAVAVTLLMTSSVPVLGAADSTVAVPMSAISRSLTNTQSFGGIRRWLQAELEPQDDEEQVGEVVYRLGQIVSHMNFEELVMMLTTLVPLTYGLLAFLRYLTGGQESSMGASAEDHYRHQRLEITKLAKKQRDSTELITRRIEKDMLELHRRLDKVEKGHATKFTELHNDLANTYWQVTKLRADLPRTTNSQCARTSTTGPLCAAAGPSGCSELEVNAGGAPGVNCSGDEIRSEPGFEVGKVAGGANAWRSDQSA